MADSFFQPAAYLWRTVLSAGSARQKSTRGWLLSAPRLAGFNYQLPIITWLLLSG